MRFRASTAVLLFISGCVTSAPSPGASAARDTRHANLQRAAALPWTDGGRCAVQQASRPWPVLAERCYPALDHERVEFHDLSGRCAVASAGSAAVGLGLCVLAAPEIVVGAVIVTGVVVVGLALHEALEAYEKSGPRGGEVPQTRPVPEVPTAPEEPLPQRRPNPEPKGPDYPPTGPIETEAERERRRRCEPIPGPPRGGNSLHDRCASNIPGNTFPGSNVFVNGKNFDALHLSSRTLWEVKTDDFDKHDLRTRSFFIQMKLPEIKREKLLAEACGYAFVVGVRSRAHQIELERADGTLKVVLMDWC